MKHSKSNVKKKNHSDLLQICRRSNSSENFKYFRRWPSVLKRLWVPKSDGFGCSGPTASGM